MAVAVAISAVSMHALCSIYVLLHLMSVRNAKWSSIVIDETLCTDGLIRKSKHQRMLYKTTLRHASQTSSVMETGKIYNFDVKKSIIVNNLENNVAHIAIF